jgi:predicted nuclease of predicted toxin-antitoxin system
MKILLDECITKRLKTKLTEYQVTTVFEMGWRGLKNGNLMTKAVENNFDIFLTIDKNIEFQQNLNNYQIAVVVLNTPNSKIEFLEQLMPKFKQDIKTFERGKIYKINN